MTEKYVLANFLKILAKNSRKYGNFKEMFGIGDEQVGLAYPKGRTQVYPVGKIQLYPVGRADGPFNE